MKKLTKEIVLTASIRGWSNRAWREEIISDETITLEKGTAVHSYGLDRFLWYRVETGVHAGLEFESYTEGIEDLCSLDKSTGRILFPQSSAGWNFSFYWYIIGAKDLPHPRKEKYVYRLKPGETLDSFPAYAWKDEQLAWLEERRARWYPEQESKVIRYTKEEQILACEILDDLIELLRIEHWELQYSLSYSNPGEQYRRQGFHLEMTSEEAYEKGRGLYYGFSWGTVKYALECPHLRHESWETPPVWVKAQREGRRGRKTWVEECKLKERYRFTITKNIDTREYYVSINKI